MKMTTAIVLAASLLASGLSTAATQLSVKKSITIAAPADKVWSTIKDFNGWTSWHPGVASDEIVSGTNNTVGAVRLLTLKGGGTVKEKLVGFDDTGHRLRYAILETALPVQHYTSNIVVTATGTNKTLVTWSGRFQSKGQDGNPPSADSDKAAVDAFTGVYQSGLDNVKKLLEAK